MAREVVYGGHDTEDDIQDPRDPDELLSKGAGEGEVAPGSDEGEDEDESEEDDGIGIQGKVLRIAVDTAAVVAFVGGVT